MNKAMVVMEFKITEAEAREMARFEEEVGCDISAGPDWGIHLVTVLEFVLNQPNHGKFVDLLKEQYGTVLPGQDVEVSPIVEKNAESR